VTRRNPCRRPARGGPKPYPAGVPNPTLPAPARDWPNLVGTLPVRAETCRCVSRSGPNLYLGETRRGPVRTPPADGPEPRRNPFTLPPATCRTLPGNPLGDGRGPTEPFYLPRHGRPLGRGRAEPRRRLTKAARGGAEPYRKVWLRWNPLKFCLSTLKTKKRELVVSRFTLVGHLRRPGGKSGPFLLHGG
jgi:hypothetical protein